MSDTILLGIVSDSVAVIKGLLRNLLHDRLMFLLTSLLFSGTTLASVSHSGRPSEENRVMAVNKEQWCWVCAV